MLEGGLLYKKIKFCPEIPLASNFYGKKGLVHLLHSLFFKCAIRPYKRSVFLVDLLHLYRFTYIVSQVVVFGALESKYFIIFQKTAEFKITPN